MAVGGFWLGGGSGPRTGCLRIQQHLGPKCLELFRKAKSCTEKLKIAYVIPKSQKLFRKAKSCPEKLHMYGKLSRNDKCCFKENANIDVQATFAKLCVLKAIKSEAASTTKINKSYKTNPLPRVTVNVA